MFTFKHPDAIRQSILDNNPFIQKDAAIGVTSTFAKELSVDEPNRLIRVRANTYDIDSDSEVVVPAGADPSPFLKMGNIYTDHQYDLPSCVGKLRNGLKRVFDADGTQRAWDMTIYISKLRNPICDDILTLARDGGIFVSIGFAALDRGRPSPEELKTYGRGQTFKTIVRRWLWVETSVTMFPANIEARQLGFDSATKSAPTTELITKRLQFLDDRLRKGQVSKETLRAFGVVEKDAVSVAISAPSTKHPADDFLPKGAKESRTPKRIYVV